MKPEDLVVGKKYKLGSRVCLFIKVDIFTEFENSSWVPRNGFLFYDYSMQCLYRCIEKVLIELDFEPYQEPKEEMLNIWRGEEGSLMSEENILKVIEAAKTKPIPVPSDKEGYWNWLKSSSVDSHLPTQNMKDFLAEKPKFHTVEGDEIVVGGAYETRGGHKVVIDNIFDDYGFNYSIHGTLDGGGTHCWTREGVWEISGVGDLDIMRPWKEPTVNESLVVEKDHDPSKMWYVHYLGDIGMYNYVYMTKEIAIDDINKKSSKPYVLALVQGILTPFNEGDGLEGLEC